MRNQFSILTTIRCIFTGHDFQHVSHRHNGIHYLCPRCGMYLWRPMDSQAASSLHVEKSNGAKKQHANRTR